jgi:N-acetylglutamate synthase-like GNAT family acetyltransferase
MSDPFLADLRAAQSSEAALIRRMVFQARINPFDLDWRRFSLAIGPNGEITGCIQVKPHRDGSRELASLVVHPEWRGRGVARRLIENMQARHPPPLYLTCRSSLQPLYLKFGFQRVKPVDMPPYFQRLHRLVNIFPWLTRKGEILTVMIWEKRMQV